MASQRTSMDDSTASRHLRYISASSIVVLSVLACVLAIGPVTRNALNLSCVHHLSGKSEVPAMLATIVAASDTRSPRTNLSFARVSILMGDVHGAAAALTALGPDAYVFAIETGTMLLSHLWAEQALYSFEVAQLLEPGTGDPHYFIGRAYTALEQEALAGESFATCAASDRFFDDELRGRCRLEQAKILAGHGQTAEARRQLTLAQADPALYFEVGKLYQSIHDSRSALALFALASENEPTNMWPCLAACETLLWSGEFGDAARWCERAVQVRPRSVTPYEYLARVYLAAQEHLQAVEVLTKAVSIEPRRAYTHYLLATALIAAGDQEQALQPLKRAVSFDGENVGYRLTLADLLVSLGQGEAAVEHYEAVLRLAPDNQHARAALYGAEVP